MPTEWLADVKRADEDELLTLAELPGKRRRPSSNSRPAAGRLSDTPGCQCPGGRTRRLHSTIARQVSTTQTPSGASGSSAASRNWRAPWTPLGTSGRSSCIPSSAKWWSGLGGPARVSGSAGTGKTIVALHRAVHLARRHPEARVLLTTFSDALANALQTRLRRLVAGEPRLAERIDVCALDALSLRLCRAQAERCARLVARKCGAHQLGE